MTHKIRIACLGVSEFLSGVVQAIVENQIIPTENIFLSDTDGPAVQRFAASGCNILDDDMNTIMKGEVVLIAAPSNEIAAVLAPVCGCTSGRYLVVISDCVHVNEILERVAKGTQVMAVSLAHQKEIAYSTGFASYMKPPCEDIVRALAVKK